MKVVGIKIYHSRDLCKSRRNAAVMYESINIVSTKMAISHVSSIINTQIRMHTHIHYYTIGGALPCAREDAA